MSSGRILVEWYGFDDGTTKCDIVEDHFIVGILIKSETLKWINLTLNYSYQNLH